MTVSAFPFMTRRSLLAGGLALAAPAPGWSGPGGAAAPFGLGVASGEPSPDGFVIWTRLAPDPLADDGGMPPQPVPVAWEVAMDAGLVRQVAGGTTLALPENAHTVHVGVTGLSAGTWYFYRFRLAGGRVSPTGRARTAPAPGAPVPRFRMVLASCQHLEQGHYAAWRDVAAMSPDLVVFCGDYIYEGPGRQDRAGRVRHHPPEEARDLVSYRRRYACYRLDPLLQAAHAACPWVVLADDHEVSNDYAGNLPARPRLDPFFAARRTAAYRAFSEHMPLRTAAGDSRFFRRLDIGSLFSLYVLDTRQFRSPPPCPSANWRGGRRLFLRDCPEIEKPHRSMLGRAQEAWLEREVGRAAGVDWNLVVQTAILAPVADGDPGSRIWTDGWDAFPHARERLLRLFGEAGPRFVALGGDIHSFALAPLVAGDRRVGTAIVSGAISSAGPSRSIAREIRRMRPDYRFYGRAPRGYTLMDFRDGKLEVVFRGVRKVADRDSPVYSFRRFAVSDQEFRHTGTPSP